MISTNHFEKNIEQENQHACRPGCAACCIAPSITSYIPGMPNGKPAGARCIQLTLDNLCALFNSDERPAVCGGFKFDEIICGNNQQEAMKIMNDIERNCKSFD